MHTELYAGFRVYEGTLVFSTVWFCMRIFLSIFGNFTLLNLR